MVGPAGPPLGPQNPPACIKTSLQAKTHRSQENVISSNVGQGLEGQGIKLKANGQMIGIAIILICQEIAL